MHNNTMRDDIPFFSIVIPVYNRAEVILPTLMSVKEQSYDNFECIVVDDGSKDSEQLKEVVLSLQDVRFRYVHQENGGGGSARNTGIINSLGQYIAFLDSDDLFLKNKLELVKQKIDKSGSEAIYSFMYVDRGSGKYWVRPDRAIAPDEDMGEYLFVYNQFIQTSTIVILTSKCKQILFDPDLRKGQDLDFCLRIHKYGLRFDTIEQPLTVWVDQTEVGRTSRTSGYRAPIEWLDRSQGLMTERAIKGYKATVLFYYMAKSKPLTSLVYLLQGWVQAGVPTKVIMRQLLRGFFPRKLYRWLVDNFVSIKGRKVNV